MTRKTKIIIKKDESLTQLDAELDDALAQLDVANQKVGALLESLDPATGLIRQLPESSLSEPTASPPPAPANSET